MGNIVDQSDLFPAARLRRALNRRRDLSDLQAIIEIGVELRTVGKGFDDITDLDGLIVAETDTKTGDIPKATLVRAADLNDLEALLIGGVILSAQLDLAEHLLIPADSTLCAPYLKAAAVALSAGDARHFKRADCAIMELAHKAGEVIHLDLAHRGSFGLGSPEEVVALRRQRTLWEHRLEHTADLIDVADKITGQIDCVGTDVDDRAAAGLFLAEFPRQRKIGIERKALLMSLWANITAGHLLLLKAMAFLTPYFSIVW